MRKLLLPILFLIMVACDVEVTPLPVVGIQLDDGITTGWESQGPYWVGVNGEWYWFPRWSGVFIPCEEYPALVILANRYMAYEMYVDEPTTLVALDGPLLMETQP